MLLQPEKGANPAFPFKLDFEAAARHRSGDSPPAGFVIQIDAVHIKTATYLFDPPFIAGSTLIGANEEFHTIFV